MDPNTRLLVHDKYFASGQVDFQFTCTNGQIDILTKKIMSYMWFGQIYFHLDKLNISWLVWKGKLREIRKLFADFLLNDTCIERHSQ